MSSTEVEVKDVSLDFVRLQFEEYADGTVSCRKLAEKCRDYFDGNQLTEEETKVLKKRKQPPYIDNKIQDKCNTLKGIEKQMRTDPKAFPRNPQDESASEVATDTLRYVADVNQYNRTARREAMDNLMVEGLCAGQVVIEKYKKGKSKICMEHIRWDRVFYDLHSLKDDFSDKTYCGYFTWMDYEEALEMWPTAADTLTASEGSTSQAGPDKALDDKPRYVMTARKRKRLQVFTHYFKKSGKWMTATWCRGGFLDQPKVSTYRNDEGEPDCCIELQALYRSGDGEPFGVVQRYLDPQDGHNKRHSKMLHLLNSKQLIAQKGAFDDVKGARDELHKPDGVIEPNPGFEYEIVTHLDVAQAQFQMLQYTDMQLGQTGPNAAIQGASGDISGVAKARDQQAGQLPISPLYDALDSWEMRMYRQVWSRARQFWTDQMFIRVTDDENKIRFVGLNEPVLQGHDAAEQLKGQQIPLEAKQAQLQQIAMDPRMQQPVIDAQGRPKIRNRLAEMDMDIIIERGQDVVNVQQEEFAMLIEIAKGRPEIPFEVLLEMSQLRSEVKKRILDRVSGKDDPAAQAQAQFQQQMQQVAAAKAQAEVAKLEATAGKDHAAMVESQVDASVKVAEFTSPESQATPKTQVSVN